MIDYTMKNNNIELYWDNDLVTVSKEEAKELIRVLEDFILLPNVVVPPTSNKLERPEEYSQEVKRILIDELR